MSVKSAPTYEACPRSCLTRLAKKSERGSPDASRVCTANAPKSVGPSRPVSFKPASIGIRVGEAESTFVRPIRLEKKGRVVLELPNAKICERWRKNGRFSGKKREARPKLNCCASASVSAKSVFTVRSASVEELNPYRK